MTELESYPCPCCGYLVFGEPPGSYEICPICFWEDDVIQLRFVRMEGGANEVSLVEGQQNYIKFGACQQHCKIYVRRPAPDEVRDREWLFINLDIDNIENPKPERIFIVNVNSDIIEKSMSGINKEVSYPDDSTQLYYWRPTYWRRTLSN